jgi:hypothetical protein
MPPKKSIALISREALRTEDIYYGCKICYLRRVCHYPPFTESSYMTVIGNRECELADEFIELLQLILPKLTPNELESIRNALLGALLAYRDTLIP